MGDLVVRGWWNTPPRRTQGCRQDSWQQTLVLKHVQVSHQLLERMVYQRLHAQGSGSSNGLVTAASHRAHVPRQEDRAGSRHCACKLTASCGTSSEHIVSRLKGPSANLDVEVGRDGNVAGIAEYMASALPRWVPVSSLNLKIMCSEVAGQTRP